MTDTPDALREREWWPEVFTPRDSLVFDERGREQIKPGGWDHEHCRICSAVISHKSETHWRGYRDAEDHWLCEGCYTLHQIGPVRGWPVEQRRRPVKLRRPWKRRERR